MNGILRRRLCDKRIVAGVLFAAMLTTGASYYLGWGFFGDYDKPAHLVTFLVGLLIFARFMPDVRRT